MGRGWARGQKTKGSEPKKQNKELKQDFRKGGMN